MIISVPKNAISKKTGKPVAYFRLDKRMLKQLEHTTLSVGTKMLYSDKRSKSFTAYSGGIELKVRQGDFFTTDFKTFIRFFKEEEFFERFEVKGNFNEFFMYEDYFITEDIIWKALRVTKEILISKKDTFEIINNCIISYYEDYFTIKHRDKVVKGYENNYIVINHEKDTVVLDGNLEVFKIKEEQAC